MDTKRPENSNRPVNCSRTWEFTNYICNPQSITIFYKKDITHSKLEIRRFFITKLRDVIYILKINLLLLDIWRREKNVSFRLVFVSGERLPTDPCMNRGNSVDTLNGPVIRNSGKQLVHFFTFRSRS